MDTLGNVSPFVAHCHRHRVRVHIVVDVLIELLFAGFLLSMRFVAVLESLAGTHPRANNVITLNRATHTQCEL